MISVTSVEAQNRFGQLLDLARREPVTVTRHGRPAAFIVSPQVCQAQVLVSSDDDLLVLDPWYGLRVMRPTEFLSGGAPNRQHHPTFTPP